MGNFEDLLKNAGFGRVSDSAIDSKIVADCIEDYLNNVPALGSFDVNRAILKLEDEGLNLRHLPYNNNGRNPVSYICSTLSNVFIKASSNFRHMHLNDAIALVTGHNEDEVHVSLVKGKSKVARSCLYFRTEDDLRVYLSRRIKHVKTAYHYDFSFGHLEDEIYR
ncbi:hypothetical protein J4476_04665 [Candidatus Woesearchaeota archaeon]|nr:hypothetical protein [Candidatus Woesearchaeota archaeon]HIH25619.1 hypothetical protein [Nanoarchaeota archaeon]